MTREQLHEKLEYGSIEDIKEVLYLHFHGIKHTESFEILLTRYIRQDKEIAELITRIEELEKALNKIIMCYGGKESIPGNIALKALEDKS